MPQNSNATKKKKKGHAPAHQNTFAFKHNPKSKKTQKILESPNIHVCRRCHDKIEWRKQYRKYKPRTQPGKCNGCQKRNVLAAYHTICESCTIHSAKAKEIIQQSTPSDDKEEEEEEDKKVTNPIDSMEADDDTDQAQQPTRQEELQQKILSITNAGPVVRACAICVKEIALPDPEGEGGEDIMDSMGRMRLRERRTLERQLAAATKEDKNDDDETDGEKKDGESQEEEEEDLNSDGDDDEMDDPFLKAVGGADQLLVGEEYQKKFLQQNA